MALAPASRFLRGAGVCDRRGWILPSGFAGANGAQRSGSGAEHGEAAGSRKLQSLRVYKQRRAELQSEMDALQKQLATLQTIVPEEKQADQFILMIQSAALSSGVSIRKLTAKPVATKPYYFEMPFDIEADGPYFSVLDFFARLGRLSRIINVGDLKLSGLGSGPQSAKFHMAPGTSVTGTFTITLSSRKRQTAAGGACCRAGK